MENNFQHLINIFNPSLFVKIITLIILAFYAIFAFVVFTQVKVMGKIVVLPHAAFIIKTIAIINIVVAVSLFLIAIVIL